MSFWGYSSEVNQTSHFSVVSLGHGHGHTLPGWPWSRKFSPSAQVIDCISPVSLRETFYFYLTNLTLKIILENLTKSKPWWKNKCVYIIFMLRTGFIIFGIITRLLLNMLNVKKKQTPGKCGKPITENISATARETPQRHQEAFLPLLWLPTTQTEELPWRKIWLLHCCLYFNIYRQKDCKMILLS